MFEKTVVLKKWKFFDRLKNETFLILIKIEKKGLKSTWENGVGGAEDFKMVQKNYFPQNETVDMASTCPDEIFISLFESNKSRTQCYRTFYGRNLWLFTIS